MEEMGTSRLLRGNSVVAHGVQVDICSTYGSVMIFLSGDRQLRLGPRPSRVCRFTITSNGITYLALFRVCGCFSSVSLLSCKPAGSSLYNKQHTSRAQCQILRDLSISVLQQSCSMIPGPSLVQLMSPASPTLTSQTLMPFSSHALNAAGACSERSPFAKLGLFGRGTTRLSPMLHCVPVDIGRLELAAS